MDSAYGEIDGRVPLHFGETRFEEVGGIAIKGRGLCGRLGKLERAVDEELAVFVAFRSQVEVSRHEIPSAFAGWIPRRSLGSYEDNRVGLKKATARAGQD